MSMDPRRGVLAFTAASALLIGAYAARAVETEAPDNPVRNETDETVRTPESIVRDWPERARLAAGALIEKYGAPQIADADSLSWVGNRPWDGTVVRRGAPAGQSIQQSIHYPVSLAKLAALGDLGGRVEFDSSSGELSSYADEESLNFLALNLADEVVTGKSTPDRARERYRRILDLTKTGKSSSYTAGFLFTPR
jgi:hypothetical protein